MNFFRTNLDGVFEIQSKNFEDERGTFVKTFNKNEFRKLNLEIGFEESFYSTSKKNVLRGMHFQIPPHDHAKLVYVTDGEILDVAVDIRKNSPTFGDWYSTKLSAENAKSLYLARGFAHGFLTLSESATVVYLTTSVYEASSDSGISWDSFGFKWPDKNLIMSKRDLEFKPLSEIYD